MKITQKTPLSYAVDLTIDEALELIASLSDAIRTTTVTKLDRAFVSTIPCVVKVGDRDCMGQANFAVFQTLE